MNAYSELLRLASEHPLVKESQAEMSQRIGELRFHEGLRRRWENARAEASVRESAALAQVSAVKIDVNDLRQLTVTEGVDVSTPSDAVAVGIWRSQWNITCGFPALNSRQPSRGVNVPLPSLLAGLHRDVCSALVRARFLDPSTVAMPADVQQLRLLVHVAQLANAGLVSALAASADMWARAACFDIFTQGSLAVGAALARSTLVHRGVEPTGCAVMSAWHVVHEARSKTALSGWYQAQNSQVDRDKRVALLAQWLSEFSQGVAHGAQVGIDIARLVQAGTLGRQNA